MILQIAGYSDPYELWMAAMDAPQPTPCTAVNKGNGQPCSFSAQGGLKYCKKHYEKLETSPYPEPTFVWVSNNWQVVHDGRRIPLEEAVLILKLGEEIPLGLAIHYLKPGSCYPDDLQLVPGSVRDEARKHQHPEGEPIRWKVEDGVARYNPTSVRLPAELIDHLDAESERLGWSRNKVLEYYLIEGIKKGTKPDALRDVLKASG